MKYPRRGTASSVGALAALAAVTMLSVQGCDAGTPAQATPSAVHSVSIADARAAYQTYITTSDTAAEQGDSATGLSDVSDAQWEIAHGQYTALASSRIPVPRYQYGTPAFYVPARSGYPRWFMVAVPRRQLSVSAPTGGSTPTGAGVMTLMVFEQANSSTDWSLDGTAALAPGQQLPAISLSSDGYAVALSTHDQSLVLPPDVLGATQAAIVDDGPASAAAAVVAPGDYTTTMYAQQSAYGNSQQAEGLDYSWLLLGAAYPVFALRTTDGGALVLYGMFLNTTTEHPGTAEGTAIPVPSAFAPLLAAPTEVGYHAVYANWTYEYAAIDPAATARNAKMQVIGAVGGPSYGHAY